MDYKKKRLALGLLLIAACVFSACGNDSPAISQDFELDVNDADEQNQEAVTDADKQEVAETNPEVETPEHRDYIHLQVGAVDEFNWNDEVEQNLVHVSYPVIRLEDCCREKFPSLTKAIDTFSEEEKTTVLSEYESLGEQALEEAQENPDYFQTYNFLKNVYVRRSDKNILSVLTEVYFWSGGAHGSTYYESTNLDVKTGKELNLSDVVTDKDSFVELLAQALEKQTGADQFYPDQDLREYIQQGYENLVWNLDYQGITVSFSAYELAPYAAGPYVATLSYREYPELIKSEYCQTPAGYGVELSEYLPYYYDFNDDGVLEELHVNRKMNEYDRIGKHIISVNGTEYEFTADGYDIDVKFMHTENGKSYLYIQDTTDNDYRILSVYSIEKENVQKVGSYDAGWNHIEEESDNYLVFEQVPVDPVNFKLETRTDVLSTIGGYKTYYVDDNGVPMTKNREYILNRIVSFTLLKPISAEVIDETTGEVMEQITLEAGTKMDYIRTDGRSFGDFRLSDGRIIRIWLDNEDWPRTIEGVNIEELFEGLFFAG